MVQEAFRLLVDVSIGEQAEFNKPSVTHYWSLIDVGHQ